MILGFSWEEVSSSFCIPSLYLPLLISTLKSWQFINLSLDLGIWCMNKIPHLLLYHKKLKIFNFFQYIWFSLWSYYTLCIKNFIKDHGLHQSAKVFHCTKHIQKLRHKDLNAMAISILIWVTLLSNIALRISLLLSLKYNICASCSGLIFITTCE